MLDLNVLYDKLEQFETADEIAYFLTREQVQAIPSDGKRCALAQWVMTVTETQLEVHVSGTKTVIYKEGAIGCVRTPKEILWCRDHTDAMVEFIQRFDHGGYPDLISKDWVGGGRAITAMEFKQEIHTGACYAQSYDSYHATENPGYTIMLQLKESIRGATTTVTFKHISNC